MRYYNEPTLRQIKYEQLVQEIAKEAIEGEDHQVIANTIEKIKVLEEFNLDKKRFFILFDNTTLRPVYASANISTEGGYNLDKYKNRGLEIFFKRVHWKQLTMFVKAILWWNHFHKVIGKDALYINNKGIYVGIKFMDSWGNCRTMCLTQKMLRVTKNNNVSLSFFEGEEITDIYKGDFVWARLTNTTNNKSYCRVYFSGGSKKRHTDLLSDRELEILKLIVQGKSSKEVSEQLSISPTTIVRHRKNMIAKVGATDMTGVIRLCQLSQVI